MLLMSIRHDSVDEQFDNLTTNPVELMTLHQGAKVSISEHESSSGACDERW